MQLIYFFVKGVLYMQYTYVPHGVCSRQIAIHVEDDTIQDVSFVGGCNGNLKGICALVKGMKVRMPLKSWNTSNAMDGRLPARISWHRL